MHLVVYLRQFRFENLCSRSFDFRWGNKENSMDARSGLFWDRRSCKSSHYQSLYHLNFKPLSYEELTHVGPLKQHLETFWCSSEIFRRCAHNLMTTRCVATNEKISNNIIPPFKF